MKPLVKDRSFASNNKEEDLKTNLQTLLSNVENYKTFLSSIIDNIPNMIFVKDAEELRFVRLNKAAEELLGYPVEELVGKNDYDFFPKEEADFFTRKDREVLAKNTLVDIPEEPIKTRYKGMRILHTKKIPITISNGKKKFLLGISEDITQQKQNQKEILEVIDREHVRIGHDLHDGLGQDLTAIAFLSKVLEKTLSKKNGDCEITSDLQKVKDISKLVYKSIGRTKAISRGLYHAGLEKNGLLLTLKDLAQTTEDIYKLKCTFRISGKGSVENKDMANHLYRIAKEAAHNAIKHAKASHIEIELIRDINSLTLRVDDDGIGIPSPTLKKEKGIGVDIMKYRAQMIEGTLTIREKKGGGTRVECFVQR